MLEIITFTVFYQVTCTLYDVVFLGTASRGLIARVEA